MGIGVARSLEAGAAGIRAGLIVAAFATLAPAGTWAQDAVPSVSLRCQGPAQDEASPAALPHLEADIAARRQIKVLAIGASAMAGLGGASGAHSYPAQFESILENTLKGLDVVILNRGVSGEVAAATADRLRTLVGLEKPDLVLWQVGTTDALARVPVEDFTATVRDTLRWLREHEIDAVLVGLRYAASVSKDEHYGVIRVALKEVARAENVPLIRRYELTEFLEKSQGLEPDPDPALARGERNPRCVAEHLARAVVVSAFLKPKAKKTGP
jgi:lysophospholipase L1-like esterase